MTRKRRMERLCRIKMKKSLYEIVDEHCYPGMSKEEVFDAVSKLIDVPKEEMPVRQSSLYSMLKEAEKTGELKLFRFVKQARGRRRGDINVERSKIHDILFICNTCGKKHKNHSIQPSVPEFFLKLRTYRCPACKSLSSCKAEIRMKSTLGRKSLVKTKYGVMEMFVNEDFQEISQNPFLVECL